MGSSDTCQSWQIEFTQIHRYSSTRKNGFYSPSIGVEMLHSVKSKYQVAKGYIVDRWSHEISHTM